MELRGAIWLVKGAERVGSINGRITNIFARTKLRGLRGARTAVRRVRDARFCICIISHLKAAPRGELRRR